MFPNFTTRINIWKGYAISSLLYQSEILVIKIPQIKKFEELEKWFLFHPNLNDNEMKELQIENKLKSNIDFNRLELPKKYGGMNLKRIEQIFSASKSKFIIRAFEFKNKDKPCFNLLFEKSELLFLKRAKGDLVHPLFTTQEKTPKLALNSWKWFYQANKVYNLIDKQTTFFPRVGDTVYDWFDKTFIHFGKEEDINLYTQSTRLFQLN